MLGIREKVLREFGDEGAETLDRYGMQIDYAVYFCVRLLREESGILAVIPEGVDDLVLEFDGYFALHQVKTRAERVGAWSLAEVLPELCAQYVRRTAFNKPCVFHFVSNATASNRPGWSRRQVGPLVRLKELLQLGGSGDLRPEEAVELRRFYGRLIPLVRRRLESDHGVRLRRNEIVELISRTQIDTDSATVRNPVDLLELDVALHRYDPACRSFSTSQLQAARDRIVLLVLRKIRSGTSIDERRITAAEVFACTAPPGVPDEYPDLDSAPGHTLLEKKLRLSGFDPTELPLVHRQKILAAATVRAALEMGLDSAVDRIRVALLDLQRSTRELVSVADPSSARPGPATYERIRDHLTPLVFQYLPSGFAWDEQVCYGILWEETGRCHAWWHHLLSASNSG